MNTAERREFELDFTGPPKVQFDFKAIRIRVYRNGDERDPGKLITITRREYKHWIVFLDALTQKLGTTTAIRRLYSTHGVRVDHFNELEHNGEYVAVERGPFIDCNYGVHRVWTQTERRWTSMVRVSEGKPIYLNSGDSMDLYLKKEGYGSLTGLPYPLDGLAKSPHVTSHLSVLSKDKIGGSLERLNKIGKEVWTEDSHSVSMSNIRGGETTEKSVIKEHSVSVTKLPRIADVEEDPQKSKREKLAAKPKEDERLPPIVKGELVPVKKESEELTKREEVRTAREVEQTMQVERKEIEEKTDVKEYAVVDKSVVPLEGRNAGGTVYKKKETMHEVFTEGSRPTVWREKRPRGRPEKMTEVVRTYEKIREYRRYIDEFDPDFVD
ncbi:hypothetical protein Q1695_011733 [Nippostrongylus brasiliensis]|nr:hypothetical protein Q1695_011733 [Nippostrongylus brasiliensis]